MLRNPSFIFIADYADPITEKFLTVLVPKLKDNGYNIFFDELSQNLTVEKEIAACKKDKRLESMPFLEALKKHAIRYKGIDIPLSGIKPSELTNEKIRALKDNLLASQYKLYRANGNLIFGRIGIAPLVGIQRVIVRHDNNALENYRFFHIYSQSTPLMQEKTKLPLGIHFIDASTMSEEEIMNTILNQTNNQNMASSSVNASPKQAIEKHEKKIKEESFTQPKIKAVRYVAKQSAFRYFKEVAYALLKSIAKFFCCCLFNKEEEQPKHSFQNKHPVIARPSNPHYYSELRGAAPKGRTECANQQKMQRRNHQEDCESFIQVSASIDSLNAEERSKKNHHL